AGDLDRVASADAGAQEHGADHAHQGAHGPYQPEIRLWAGDFLKGIDADERPDSCGEEVNALNDAEEVEGHGLSASRRSTSSQTPAPALPRVTNAACSLRQETALPTAAARPHAAN